MGHSSALLYVLPIVSTGLFGVGCTSFTGVAGSDTDDGASSTGAPMGSSSDVSSTTVPTSSSASSSSTSGDPSTSTTDSPSSSSSSSGESSAESESSSSSGESSAESESGETGRRCDEGELCAGACVDTDSDLAHCGGCGDACSTENATPMCTEGACVLSCNDGFDNCDLDPGTGCEQSLATPTHCGACDLAGTPEICDGIDNDCAAGQIIDNGCPEGVILADGGFGAHTLFGNTTGGDAFEDVCPAGAALVGFSGNVGGNIDRIRGICGVMSLEVDTGVVPYAYSISSGATSLLPTRGLNVTTPFSIECPADAFVVGISGEASGGGLRDVTIHCAPLLVDGVPGSFAVTYGAVTTATVDGENPGDAYTDQLSEPAVVDRYRGRAGNWNDAIGIGEATVTLEFVD